MNKSIFERIFPHSPGIVLPQYNEQDDVVRESRSRVVTPPHRILLTESSIRQSTKLSPSNSPRVSLKSAPLSASIIHHDDPFLPVERAAKSLERNIQAFLDAQSEGLKASVGGDDDLSSIGSPTPTPSIATPTRSHAGLKTVPIRQPSTKKITLRGARKGLARAMEDFAQLRDEELHIIDIESNSRNAALQQTQNFEDKKHSLQSEIDAISSEDATTGAESLREEADRLNAEIQALENRLFELRTRHRHLTTKASQLENSIDSKLSSYKSSLALVDKDITRFLHTPPIPFSLSAFNDTRSTRSGMYAVQPSHRTLQIAQEHWLTEQNSLSLRRADVQDERDALQEGAKLWRTITQQIADYERDLRRALRPTNGSSINDSADPTPTLLAKINTLITNVSTAQATAEQKQWNLLIAALGAELEALRQGQRLLGGDSGGDDNESNSEDYTEAQSIPTQPPLKRIETNGTNATDNDDPPPDLLNDGIALHGDLSHSSESLQDTLREFGDDGNSRPIDKGKAPVRNLAGGGGGGVDGAHDQNLNHEHDPWAPTLSHALATGSSSNTPSASRTDTAGRGNKYYKSSESEDDEPGPDFLVEHG